MASRQETTEPFPSIQDEDVFDGGHEARNRHSVDSHHNHSIRSSTASTVSITRERASTVVRAFLHSNPPNGMWQATGEVMSKVPTLGEIRSGAFSRDGWTEEGQRERRGTTPQEIHRSRRSTTSSISQGSRARSGNASTPDISRMASHAEEGYPATIKDVSERIPHPVHEHEEVVEPMYACHICRLLNLI